MSIYNFSIPDIPCVEDILLLDLSVIKNILNLNTRYLNLFQSQTQLTKVVDVIIK